MKKILAILGIFGLTDASVMPVMACKNTDETIKGLKATIFSTKLYGAKSDEEVSAIILYTFFLNALNEVQQKEISNKKETAFFIFGFSFNYKLGEDVSFPLKEGDKITITITKKTTDKEINASLIALTGKELSVEELKTVKKYQEYVSGSKFSDEITVVEPPEDEQNNHWLWK